MAQEPRHPTTRPTISNNVCWRIQNPPRFPVLTPEQIAAELRARCVADPLELLRICLPKIATLKPPQLHRDIADALQDPVNLNHNFVAPRGFAKTSVSVLGGSLWHTYCSDEYFERNRRPHFSLIVSRSRAHSINLLTSIKNVLEYGEEFKALFGYHGRMTARKWSEDFVYTRNGDVFMAKGMAQMVRGLNIGGMRPDFGVLDDGEDEENTKTRERMEANLRWFLQAFMNVGGERPMRTLNIGTPQHQRAIVFTLEDMSDWQSHHYSAIIEDPVTGEEKSLWPEMRSIEWLRAKRQSLEDAGRGSVFQREYMCRVVGDEDQLFREDDIQYFRGKLFRDEKGKAFLEIVEKGDEKRLVPVNVFMGVDPASSVQNNADYTAIVVIAVDKEGNRYVIDVLRKRLKPMDVARQIIAYYRKYKPEKSQIETVGYQSMLADYITREAGVYIPGLAITNNPRRGKTERLEGLQPIFFQKKVFLIKSEEEVINKAIQHFVDELLLFPRSRHDDCIDGFFYANKGAYRPYHEAPAEGVKKGGAKTREKVYDWEIE